MTAATRQLCASSPLFVTLNTLSRRGKSLRGCIGSLSPRPLSELKDYTYSRCERRLDAPLRYGSDADFLSLLSVWFGSAFRDRRFHPLSESEIPTLEIGISLLVKYEKGDHCLDWEVGKHGIIIEFRVKGERFSATYLPEVAAEQGEQLTWLGVC